MKVRKHVFFSGHVQGVGFRFHAVMHARTLGLTGWVRNLYDGRVEMEVQGEEEIIYRLFSALRKDRWIRIEQIDTYDIPLEKNETAFKETW